MAGLVSLLGLHSQLLFPYFISQAHAAGALLDIALLRAVAMRVSTPEAINN